MCYNTRMPESLLPIDRILDPVVTPDPTVTPEPVLTSDAGTYVLVMKAPDTGSVTIGKLGRIDLERGWLLYVGSAFGPGGLGARIRRHLRDDKTLHWHIDYLLAELDVVEVWWTDDDTRWEEAWAETLRRMPDARVPLRRFGSGDCGCEGHLIHLPSRPDTEALRERGGAPTAEYSIRRSDPAEVA